jgi:hypothetical protein
MLRTEERNHESNGENLIEIIDDNMFIQEGIPIDSTNISASNANKIKIMAGKHRRVKSGASDQLQNKNANL